MNTPSGRKPLLIAAPDQGVLFVASGPSGVGKSTVVQEALARLPHVSFSVSATTRAPRPLEVAGRDYHFLDATTFASELARGAFLEHAQVYDRQYGTPAAPVREALAAGRSILLDVDVRGAAQVRKAMPNSVHIFVLPPSLEVLEARLRTRGSEDEATIARRMALAAEQVRGAPAYDYIVINDDLEAAHATFQGILLAETSTRGRRMTVLRRLLAEVDAHS